MNQFSVDAITGHHKHGDLNNTSMLSYSSVSQKSEKGLMGLKLQFHTAIVQFSAFKDP